MTSDLLLQLEQKVAHAIEVIELLRMQVEELETENMALKEEHDKWRKDLLALIKRFDKIEALSHSSVSNPSSYSQTNAVQEEEFMTV